MAKHIFETADCVNYEVLKQNARNNRNNPTEAERFVWNYLSGGFYGYKFRRQHIIGNYIADFVCLPKRLVVEIDGGYHEMPEQIIADEERTKCLNRYGFNVIRFTNEEVFQDIENVLLRIKSELL